LVDDDSSKGIFRVNRRAFTDPDILALEQGQIFERCWLYAAHESELPLRGDFVVRTIAQRHIIIVRGTDGEVRGFFNTCTHKGAQVCRESSGNARGFRCPYHSWFFGTDGKLTTVPQEEAYGPHFDKQKHGLVEVPRLDICHGFIFLSLAGQGQTLPEWLAGAVDILALVAAEGEQGMEIVKGSHSYKIKSNWKLLLENSSDGYHLAPVHQRYLGHLEEMNGADEMRRLSGSVKTTVTPLGNGHCAVETTPPLGGRITAYWHSTFGEHRRQAVAARRSWFAERYGEERAKQICDTARVVQIFPNLMIQDIMVTSIRQFFPTDTGEMIVNAWALFPKNQDDEDRKMALEVFPIFLGPGGFATPDDIEILESCWQGFANKEVEWHDNSRGVHRDQTSARSDDESQMRAFWRQWDTMITGRKGNSVANVVPAPALGLDAAE
jgi:phenylpropionate dioxygenase-like ring-hydroxylating dioxygenase large terminal subunit